VRQWLTEISWEQLREWYAYYTLEPFGEGSAWLRHGIWCELYASAHYDKKSGYPRPVAEDFMPFAEKPKSDPTAAWDTFTSGIKSMGKAKVD
jgi:hypothetical protein